MLNLEAATFKYPYVQWDIWKIRRVNTCN